MSTSIYKQNKYLKWYGDIISNAQTSNRYKSKERYYENHHIIPKSFGGLNSKDNLVLLTAREHYICHYLLTKFTSSKYKSKMVLAFHRMNTSQQGKIHFNSRLYESNKVELSVYLKNRKHTDETKKKMSESMMNIDHHLCIGLWVTPWGEFKTRKQLHNDLISTKTVTRWCKKPNEIITHYIYCRSKYLQSLNKSPLGKTFNDIGFNFRLY